MEEESLESELIGQYLICNNIENILVDVDSTHTAVPFKKLFWSSNLFKNVNFFRGFLNHLLVCHFAQAWLSATFSPFLFLRHRFSFFDSRPLPSLVVSLALSPLLFLPRSFPREAQGIYKELSRNSR